MELPLLPPVQPMLARLARALPVGEEYLYEPKWDGFRSLVFRSDEWVDMRSRNQRPLSRYFPELVDAFSSLTKHGYVLDGEILVSRPEEFDFVALLQRLHPAESRVSRLSRETPACFVAFDLLARGEDDLRALPFRERRRLLEELLAEATPPIFLSAVTDQEKVARIWLERLRGGGVDGLVAKHGSSSYQPGKRAMIKVKHELTADCVVGGFRWHRDEPTVGSLLLGLYADDGELHHVGLASGFTATLRRQLLRDVAPLVVDIAGHAWEQGFNVRSSPVGRLPGAASRWAEGRELTWVPLAPELVCEVAYDRLQGDRFRHAARWRRWRPDREALSCTYAQLEGGPRTRVAEILGWAR